MKKPLLFLLVLFVSTILYAQKVSSDAKNETTSPEVSAIPVFTDATAEQLVQEIMDKVGLKGNFTIKAANVLNVQADVKRGRRYIEYNPEYINKLLTVTKDKWVLTFILAHEIGHHLNGHTVHKGKHSPEIELEADEFAGFVLSKMGASLEEAKIALSYISRPQTSKTHPGRSIRLLSIEDGWKRASSREASGVRAEAGEKTLVLESQPN
jgi:hypothetical protein